MRVSRNWSERLRTALRRSAECFARIADVPMYVSSGGTVLFEPCVGGTRHGSFTDESYAAILANPAWKARLGKAHAQRHALPEERRATACELDSGNSSDALLMNLFCYPGFSAQPAIAELLGHDPAAVPEFGVAGRVPLTGGGTDSTELDMRIGNVIVESKLTEADFASRRRSAVERYRDFAVVFEMSALPQTADSVCGYQLIRNILCAAEYGHTFALLCDARRPDLIHEWWHVVRAVRDVALRIRCRLVLWQELAAAAPRPLSTFLTQKYGLGPGA